MTSNKVLDALHQSTEDDRRFAIGAVVLSDCGLVPIIHIRYCDQNRVKLEAERNSFTDGVIFVNRKRHDGTYHLFIGARERVAMQSEENGHKSVLRTPAWDAQLPGVDASVVREFEANRPRYGGFLLLVQTPEWEFLTVVGVNDGSATVGPITDRRPSTTPAAIPNVGGAMPVAEPGTAPRERDHLGRPYQPNKKPSR